MAVRRTVRYPLQAVNLVTGFTGLRPVLFLKLRNRHHQYQTLQFVWDSGTNITTIPVAEARNTGLVIPSRVCEVEARTTAGVIRQHVRPAWITVRVPDLDGRTFVWPCHLVESEDPKLPALLGPPGVINDLKIDFDPSYALEAPHGWLVLEERAS